MKRSFLKILQITLLIVTCLVSGVMVEKTNIFTTSVKAFTQPTVIIDAGHGGLTNTID